MDKTRKIVKQLHDVAAKMLEKNLPDEEIIVELKKMGIDHHYAEMVLSNAREIKSDKKEFYKHLVAGVFILAAGVTVSIGTYVYAQTGGLYLVSTGVIVYGVYLISRAFIIFGN